MYNIFEDREFKYSFEDLCLTKESDQETTDTDQVEKLKTLWSYFEEGKTKHEVELLMSIPDRRTKEGKWAATIRSKYGLSCAVLLKGKYKYFVKRERKLIAMEA